jgi:hypothetical protein
MEDNRLIVARLRRGHDPAAVWTADAYDFDFTPSMPRFFLAKGWWSSEWAGSVGMAWAVGRESTLGFFLPAVSAMTMELRVNPFVYPAAPQQLVTVNANGEDVAHFVLAREWTWRTYSADIPARSLRPGFNTLRFRYAYSAAPRDITPGDKDTRQLAVAFNRVTLKRR